MYQALLVQSVVSRTVIVVVVLIATEVPTVVLMGGDTLLKAQRVVGCLNHAVVAVIIVAVVEDTSLRQDILSHARVGRDGGGSRGNADDEGGGDGELHLLFPIRVACGIVHERQVIVLIDNLRN